MIFSPDGVLLQSPFLGERNVNSQGEPGPYEWVTYKQVRKVVKQCALLDANLTLPTFLHTPSTPSETSSVPPAARNRHLTSAMLAAAIYIAVAIAAPPLFPSLVEEASRRGHPGGSVCARQPCQPRRADLLPRRSQFGEARTAAGSGLLRFGLAPHQTVGIYSVNCTAWVTVAEACSAYSMVSVPLYDTLGPDSVRCVGSRPWEPPPAPTTTASDHTAPCYVPALQAHSFVRHVGSSPLR